MSDELGTLDKYFTSMTGPVVECGGHPKAEVAYIEDGGYFRVSCPDCGLYLISDEAGMRTFGWIE